MDTIVVTGATGNVGSAVLTLLDPRTCTVRALVRCRPGRPVPGVEYHVGDLGDTDSVDRLLSGADRAFLACANSPDQVRLETHLIDRAVRQGLSRIVKLSAFGAAADAPVAFWRWHAEIEDHLAASGLEHVLVRPFFYMSNLLPALAPARALGLLFAPAGQARVAMIDPRDVAAVAVGTLTGGTGPDRALTLTGPEALDHHDVARAMTRVLGRQVAYQEIDETTARDQMVTSGLPGFVADQVLAVYARLRAGMQSQPDDSVRRITGHAARSLDDYLRHLDDGRPDASRPDVGRAGGREHSALRTRP